MMEVFVDGRGGGRGGGAAAADEVAVDCPTLAALAGADEEELEGGRRRWSIWCI